eukprot:10345081-Alexandrium_andersonii.AAC.1
MQGLGHPPPHRQGQTDVRNCQYHPHSHLCRAWGKRGRRGGEQAGFSLTRRTPASARRRSRALAQTLPCAAVVGSHIAVLLGRAIRLRRRWSGRVPVAS